MAARELTFKVNVDPRVATAEMNKFTQVITADLHAVTNVTREQQQAVIALQRQRSAALIADWKREERAAQQTEAAKTAEAQRGQQAVISLQRQRSAALIAEWRREERESQRTEAAKLRETQRAIAEAVRAEQRRTAEAVRSANQRLREEQRAAREIARINAQTARQAEQQEKLRERAAKNLADVQIREAKRAAKELESSLRQGQGSAGGGAVIFGALGRVPALGNLTSELQSFTAATEAAGASQAGLAGPIGVAVAAAVAEVAIIVKLSQGLFDLAKQTAAFEGRLFDMSQQVGVSVETLSALEVLATTTGGSIETVAASLAIFQRNLEAAHDPTSKEAKLLAELGVSATDTEEALTQTLQGLFRMGEGSRQTSAALELFGRSGRFVLAILKEADGDLERAKQRFRELGILVGGDSAKAADQFNDSLATLQFQIRGLVAELGNQIIPTITAGLQQIQRIIKDNKDGFEALGFAARGLTFLIGAPLVGAIQTLGFIWKVHEPIIRAIAEVYERLAAAMQLVTGNIPELSGTEIPAQPLGEKSGIKLLREVEAALKASGGVRKAKPEIPEGLLLEKDKAAADPGVTLLRQLQQELRGLEGATKAQEIAARLLDEQFKDVNATLREQILTVAKTVDMRRAANEADQEAVRLAAKQKQEIQAATDSLTQFLQQQGEALRQIRFGDKTQIQQAEEFIALFPKWTKAMSDAEVELIRLNARLLESAARTRTMIDLLRESINLVPPPSGGAEVSVPATVPVNVGLPPPETLQAQIDAAIKTQGAFAGLGVAMSDVFGLGSEAAVAFAETMGVAFSGVANAVGEAVRAFVLFGTAQGGFRKFAAEVIASIAQMAVVNAVWEAAQGLAMLALTWFTGNPKYAASAGAHFAAAAAYGIIAGVAVPLGRPVAGNTFQQPGGGASGNTDDGRPDQLNPLALERNTGQRELVLKIQLEQHVKSNDSHIVKTIVKDYQSGGDTREVINTDGVRV